MAKVVVVSTGGTIAMKVVPGQGVVPALSGADLIAAVPQLADLCEVEVREFSNVPSPHMTPTMMFELACRIEAILEEDDVAGVVVTHGTDTLEETAYMLDLVIDSPKPVCVTGAMRSASGVGPDGPANILAAVRTAASFQARHQGVLVVLNDEINAAREVTKTHSANPDTFCAPAWGPLGYADRDRVIFRRLRPRHGRLRPQQLESDVHLLRLAAGSDSRLIRHLIADGVKGIVIEAFGRGNVPPAVVPGVQEAVAAGIPVVVTTRCGNGRVFCEYGYEGSTTHLARLGVLLAGDMLGVKARLKLMLALSLGLNAAGLAQVFEEEMTGECVLA